MLEFSEKDLKRGIVVQPAWYRMLIEEAPDEGTPSSDGKSLNYVIEGLILADSDTGDEQFKGVPITWNFNSKAPGFAVGFLESLGVQVQSGVRYRLSDAKGKVLDVFVENGEYQGRTVNRVNHKYRAAKA